MTAKKPRRTAERILDVTLALFNRFGEPNVSTSQLCGELGMSPGNLFYHHPTREALVAGLFGRYQAALEQALQGALPRASPVAGVSGFGPGLAHPTAMSASPGRAPGAEPASGSGSGEDAAWWLAASPPLARLARLAEALAATAWAYRFLFRDLNDLVSRHRLLEEAMPALLRRQAAALVQALRDVPWAVEQVDEPALQFWAGPMLASLTGCIGLDGALDPREHLRAGRAQAVDRAVGRALGLLLPALTPLDRQAAAAHLSRGDQLGGDPWWLQFHGR